jgi:hypothetical protein
MTNRSSPPVVPSAPFDLVAVTINGFQVILAWTECENSTLGFHVERADGVGSACRFLQIGRTASHVIVYHDDSVTPRKTYSFRVHAWNRLICAGIPRTLSSAKAALIHRTNTGPGIRQTAIRVSDGCRCSRPSERISMVPWSERTSLSRDRGRRKCSIPWRSFCLSYGR